MIFKTTLNVHNTILDKIEKAMSITGMKRDDIIVYLLKYAMKDSKKLVRTNSLIKYQMSDPLKRWRRLHVNFPEKSSNFFIDIRGVFRMSLSNILRYVVIRYFNEIIEKLLKLDSKINPDNYLYYQYNIKRKEVDSDIFWEHTWKKT